MVQAFWSGILQRPEMRSSCWNSLSSLTELAVGLTEPSGLACCARAGAATATIRAIASAPTMNRMRVTRPGMTVLRIWLRRDGFAIGRLPAPGAGAIAALDHALLVDLGDDLAVAGEQRLGRAHLGAQRQLALGQPVGAVLLVLLLGAVRLGTAGAIGALVHLAARAEVADLGILRRAERA